MTSTSATPLKPLWWFRSVHDSGELKTMPQHIEYLKVWTGETFVHAGGTAFWSEETKSLSIHALMFHGITHWRLVQIEKIGSVLAGFAAEAEVVEGTAR